MLIVRTANAIKAPNPKSQIPNKHQAQISKLFKSLNFGYCVRQLAD